MKVSYRQAADDDVIRQFRYYLVTLNLPEIAVRFRDSVRRTIEPCADVPGLVPIVVPPILNSSLSVHGPWRDLRRSGFITLWTRILFA